MTQSHWSAPPLRPGRCPCHADGACVCGRGHPQRLSRNVDRQPAQPPIPPRQNPRDRALPVPPSCPCRAGGKTHPCACLSTPPRCSAVRRDWGLSLKLSTAPRKAPCPTHAAGVSFVSLEQAYQRKPPTPNGFSASGRDRQPSPGRQRDKAPPGSHLHPFSTPVIFLKFGLCNAGCFGYKPAHRSPRRYPGGE